MTASTVERIREFQIVLRIICADHEEDPRRWDFDGLLAPPDGDPDRLVEYVSGVEVKRP